MMLQDGVGLATAVVLVFVVAAGSALLSSDTPDTYTQLRKPAWAPPAWLFGPVWTLLYAAVAVAGWMAWRSGADAWALGLWGFQLVLNGLWSPLFFRWGLRGAAFAEILMLDAAVAATILLFARTNVWAAWLLVPYLAWTLFASALNGSLWWLNR